MVFRERHPESGDHLTNGFDQRISVTLQIEADHIGEEGETKRLIPAQPDQDLLQQPPARPVLRFRGGYSIDRGVAPLPEADQFRNPRARVSAQA